MNLYLGLGTAEMSVVLSLQSLSMECHVNSSSLSHSLSVVCSVQCAGRVSLKALCPSFPDLRVSGGGMACEETQCLSLPPHLFSDDVQHRCPGPCIHTCPLKRNTCWEFL